MNNQAVRRKLSKTERQKIYANMNGRCAYCGCEIEYKDMQVDHIKPLRIGGADTLDNMISSCRRCNHYKSTLDLEGFRTYLHGIHERLSRDSVPYQTGKRFGMIKEVHSPVIFYFERRQKPEEEAK